MLVSAFEPPKDCTSPPHTAAQPLLVSLLAVGSVTEAAPHAVAVSEREAGAKVTVDWVANWKPKDVKDGIGAGKDVYKMYKGSGSTADGWPSRKNWVSFEDM